MTEWLVLNKNILLVLLCLSAGFPFFLPFSLFKKGRKFIVWVIEKEYSDYRTHMIFLVTLAVSLTVIFLAGVPGVYKFLAGISLSFCLGIGGINGIRNANGG